MSSNLLVSAFFLLLVEARLLPGIQLSSKSCRTLHVSLLCLCLCCSRSLSRALWPGGCSSCVLHCHTRRLTCKMAYITGTLGGQGGGG